MSQANSQICAAQGRLRSVEISAVKILADGTKVDLGTLCYRDMRPWYQRAWDRVRGRGRPNIGRITVGA